MTPDDELFLQTVLKLGLVTQSRADACIQDAGTGARVCDILVNSGILRGSHVGRTLGGCLLVQKIGEGGMGEVYKARHLGLDKSVAVKVLPPGDDDGRTRFLREARTLAKVEHPNIVAVHHVGDEQGVHFIVMQYLEGSTLADRIRKGPIPAPEAARIGRDIARGLHAAHQAGVVHRDLKPGNVILTGSGVKVIDFGLAREAKADREITRAGDVVGSPHYMAPEQCTGRTVDARTDLYALGATLYHMLTGVPPYTGETLYEILDSHVHAPPPDPRAKQPDVPAGLAGFVQRLLAKNPAERPEDAEVVARELDRHVGSEARSTPLFSWPAVVGGLLGLTIAVIFVMQAVKRPRPPPPPKKNAPAARKETPEPVKPLLGTVEIVTVPEGATVELDGKVVGKTPVVLEGLEIREYALKVSLENHESWERGMAPSTAKGRISLGLKPFVKVDVACTSYGRKLRPGALKFTVDGKFVTRVPSGLHEIRIEHDQIETWTSMVDVRPGETWTVPAEIVAKPRWNGMVFVPAGRFFIGEFEVTEGEWGDLPRPRVWEGDPKMPVRSVTFQQASEYATSKGLRLPTAAEWELAARGEKARAYPWGDAAPTEWPKKPVRVGESEWDVSAHGCRDMGANLREWTVTQAGDKRVLKGGSFADTHHAMKIESRQLDVDTDTSAQNGFRCVAEYLPGLFED